MNHLITFDGKGELLITIMSSLAQEESRSISENVIWGHRKRMADGKVYVAYDTGEYAYDTSISIRFLVISIRFRSIVCSCL